jgi:hypothetical protein
MASHMFSARQFNTWVQSVIHNELDVIDGLLDNVATNPSGTIAMPDLFFRYTLSSFSKMAFSADLNCLSSDPSSLNTPVPFAVAFDFAQGVINERFVLPGWHLFEKFSSKGRKMRESIKVINDFAMGIIEKRLAESEREKYDAGPDVSETTLQNNGKDLLGFFMEHTKDPNDLLVVVLNFVSLRSVYHTVSDTLILIDVLFRSSLAEIQLLRPCPGCSTNWLLTLNMSTLFDKKLNR